jgi:hypothetical protein
MTTSRPILIGVGGSYRGVGKTTFAALILQTFTQWGAIKYTPAPLYRSIIEDIGILSQEGKDTKRFLDAGAEKTLWVHAPQGDLDALLPVAIDRLSGLQGILIEGNSAIMCAKPECVIFVCGDESARYKKSASALLSLADVILFDTFIPPDTPPQAKRFKKEHVTAFLDCISGLIEKNLKEC